MAPYPFGHVGHYQDPGNTMHTVSLQETNTYRSIPTLGQQPLHNSQKQHIQDPSIQGHSSFQHTRRPYKGTGTLRKALKQCQFPNWVLNRLQQQFLYKHNLNNNNTQEEDQTNNKTDNNRQQNKNSYMVILYIKRIRRKVQKDLQKTRHPSTLQGNKCCQTITYGSQGQGP